MASKRIDRAVRWSLCFVLFQAGVHCFPFNPGVIREAHAAETDPPALSPAESMEVLHVRDGFVVELVASEPLVIDPVAIDWGPDGRLWVVEMSDYPLGMDGEGQPGGLVRFLEDTDNDGRYDRSTVFLEGLPFPTGILVWGRGVLITAAPELVYAEDTDGDGRADIRRTVYSGFLQGNQQLRVNGLRWGLDNWVYCASGSHHAGYGKDSRITSHLTDEKIRLGSRDFRIRPDEGLIDPQSGPSQFGRARDDWGNWYGVQNSHPLWHYVLADHYIRRNSHYAPPDPRQQVIVPTNPPVYSAKPPQARFHSFDQSGRFTSACAPILYRDSLLFDGPSDDDSDSARPPILQHAFTCEPTHNLIQHNLILDDGVSFTFRRDPDDGPLDFFASKDRWCRPVMIRTGPDGALWVVDMYRYMIEHPQWLPPAGKETLRPNYRSGDNLGRIYRVYRTGQSPRQVPKLDKLAPHELVASLASPSGWERDTAQRMLVNASEQSRSDRTIAALEALATGNSNPLARIHALCTLDGLDALPPKMVERALTDAHLAVRREAVRLAEGRSVDVAVLVGLVNDPNAKVRLQVANTLGEFDDLRAARGLAELALRDSGNSYIIAAVFSSLNERNIAPVLAAVMAPDNAQKPSPNLVKQLFGQVAALGDRDASEQAIALVCRIEKDTYETWQFEALAELLDVLATPVDSINSTQREQLRRAIATARKLAADEDAVEAVRAAAVRLLFRNPEDLTSDVSAIDRLLVPQTPVSVQQATVAHAARYTSTQIASALLAGWRSHSPALRAAILGVVASRDAWVDVLLNRLEKGDVAPGEIDASLRQRLATTKNVQRQARLQRIFSLGTTDDRQQVLEQYRAALKLKGDLSRGEAVFRKKCLTCHKIDDEGFEVGPNLVSLTNRTPEAMYTSLLDPSAAVEAKYMDYIVITVDGRSRTGMLVTETGSSITLLAAEGKQETILRSDVDELQSTSKSLMPDGLEKDLSKQDIADLLRFVEEMGKKKTGR